MEGSETEGGVQNTNDPVDTTSDGRIDRINTDLAIMSTKEFAIKDTISMRIHFTA